MRRLARWWHQAFLAPRPSISLGLFRLAVAFTVGAHVLPSFCHMEDNYLSTAFKTNNFSFFPVGLLRLVETSPDGLVWAFAALFVGSLATFALGLYAQLSGILLTVACYYFYALNALHIGTLSWDILLVTLVLMCVTGYHGDALSLDSLRRGDARAWRRRRPFFVQRLLQLQLAVTFWQTALNKTHFAPEGADLIGNWLTDNPYFYLMHYPLMGVVREFPLRAWLGEHPTLCYGLGVALMVVEIVLPLCWLFRPTRAVGIALGIAFQLMLWLTLHVPTIFLFLFPPMMLLFIPPEAVTAWLARRRALAATRGRAMLLYDGRCGLCRESVKRLRVLDLFGRVAPRDLHAQADLARLHPTLTAERLRSEMVLIEPSGRLSGGFEAARRLSRRLILLWWSVPLVHLPGAAWIGTRLYRWVAARRYLFHRGPRCRANQCAGGSTDAGSANV
jgi:predicted DCC family thiol-disulfide oxidoreductase YuxK